MGTYTFILGLNYESSNDALTGTLIVLNSANEIQMNTPLILFRDKSVPVTNPDPSVADGKWVISASGTELELTIDSSDKTVDPTDDKIADFKATGSLKTVFSGFPITVSLTSGKIHEVTPETPDYWYNSTIDKTSEMYLNPSSVGGTKVKVTGILRAKETTNFGTLSRGVYYTKAFANKYMTDSGTSSITADFKDHILNKRYGVSQFNAYVKIKYDDYSDDDGTEASIHRNVDGYASALNGDQTSSIVSIFASFLNGGTDNLKNDKLHLRAVAGLKVNDIVDENDQSIIDHHEIIQVPQTISFYPKNFEKKDLVTSYLNRWNSNETLKIDGVDVTKDERSEITYTDTISMIVTVISTLVTTISIALIAFTSLSLVVSCFMIAVITYISVMERVKEIGVIRSLGGRKKDVSRLFIAENLITGFSSGAFGILVTYILQIIINVVVKFFGVPRICALPWYFALMMVGIAVILSVVSGLIPSFSASKQDPVIALRTE